MRRGEHLQEVDIDGLKILNWIVKKNYVLVWAGFVWLRLGASDGML
jgi:hypothetical protein